MKSYNQVASKLVYNQSTIPAFGNMDAVQPRDAPFANKAADAAVVLVQKGHSGLQSSEGPGDLDCDSDDLPGELVKFYLVLTSSILKEDIILEHLFV
jgi:BRCA1-associated RING domain protein 1